MTDSAICLLTIVTAALQPVYLTSLFGCSWCVSDMYGLAVEWGRRLPLLFFVSFFPPDSLSVFSRSLVWFVVFHMHLVFLG